MAKPFERFSPPNCICFRDAPEYCVCSHQERGMRAVINGAGPISEEEREWCLSEIERVEGYDRSAHVRDDDRMLVGNVFSAWLDFCRDKGLI